MDEKEVEKIKEARKEYEKLVARELEKNPELKSEYTTDSWIPVDRLYTPVDVAGIDYLRDIGFPGQYPYTRGLFPSGYRTRAWNRRQVAARGTADECNKLAKFLISQGQTAFALHAGTFAGKKTSWDTDDPIYLGHAFRHNTKMDTLADWEDLYDGIDLSKFHVMVGVFPIDLAMFIAMAEKRGYSRKTLQGSSSAQVRLILYPENKGNPFIDMVEFCTKEMPYWNAFYIDAANIRDGGLTAVQELAWGIAVGKDGIREVLKRGLEIDSFAPRIHSYFRVGNDLFEEVAKFRALRRMWARMMREELGAKDPRSWRLRVHVQSLGPTFTAQQPLNNLVRGTIHALAAALGGVQSLAVDTYDEALSTPSDIGKVLALRTQQIVEHESGVTNVVDPLGGSYYVEWLTNKMEEEAQKIIDKLEEMGGACKSIKACTWFLQQKREAAYKRQKEIDTKKRIVVGVNEYVMDEKEMLSTFVPEVLDFDYKAMLQKQIERLNKVRRERDNSKVEWAKKMLYDVFKSRENMMPALIEAVKTYISAGEIMKVLIEARGPQYGLRGENTIEKEIELGLFNFD